MNELEFGARRGAEPWRSRAARAAARARYRLRRRRARAARRDPFDTRYANTRPWVLHSRDDRRHPARRRRSPAGARRPDLTLTFEGLRKRRGK